MRVVPLAATGAAGSCMWLAIRGWITNILLVGNLVRHFQVLRLEDLESFDGKAPQIPLF
jgi:hypothetical protein